MSRRIRVNLTRWVCRMIGHDWLGEAHFVYCLRCGRWFT